MFITILALLPACIVAVAVRRAPSAPDGHEFIAPGPDDVRSPCPGLNSAANHGFLPRSGKNITALQAAIGLKEGLNVGYDFGLLVGAGATSSNPEPLAMTFNMDQLREHNFPIEHDVSLSRQDYHQGDNLAFNQTVFDQVLAFYEGMDHTTLPVAVQAQLARVETQRALNGPKEIYGPRQVVLSLVETSLYMSIMGNPLTGDAPISYVKEFFEQERLPYELGWTAPAEEVNFATLVVMAAELLAMDPRYLEQVPEVTLDLVKDVYQLQNPLVGVIVNATCKLLPHAC